MRFLIICGLLATSLTAAAQPAADYFQQRTDYRIQVTLDDERHELRAELQLTYTNNSPDRLNYLLLHVWPRAYRSGETAFGQQQLRNGQTDFYFAPEAERGTLDGLDFRVGGRPAAFRYYQDEADIIRLELPVPLAAGDSVLITTPFRVVIPRSWSRLGHVGRSYQVTQWYPKPAVYDRAGWHPLPYLDQGEFYSEFGNYEVAVTLPENYTVGATGLLQNEAERKRLLTLAAATRRAIDTAEAAYGYEPIPPSAAAAKTLTYRADSVHDFAWFADKRFRVLHDTLQLPGRPEAVDVWAYYTATEAHLWQHATGYLKRAVRFYSDRIGTYPYPQVTAVQSALSAGAGMEYPMITVIGLAGNGRDLDEVLTHEVGHNWFYGLLASNERDYAWMDEGLNSYYEQRYMQRYYPAPPRRPGGSLTAFSLDRSGYGLLARQAADQPPSTTAEGLTYWNYWMTAYSKPDLALRQLAAYVGQERLDRAMQAYFRAFAFRHPQPADLRLTLETELNEDLGWLFTGFLESTAVQDYSLRGARYEKNGKLRLQLRNNGEIAAPVPLTLERKRGESETVWLGGFNGDTTLFLDAPDVHLARLDANRQTLDLYPANNARHTKGAFSGPRQLKLRLGTHADNGTGKYVFLSPLATFTDYDRLGLGLVIHNRTIEPKMTEFAWAPYLATNNPGLHGFLGIRQRFLIRDRFVKEGQLITSVRGGGYRYINGRKDPVNFIRSGLTLQMEFQHPAAGGKRSYLSLQSLGISREEGNYNADGRLANLRTVEDQFYTLEYRYRNPRTLAPLQFTTSLEYRIGQEERIDGGNFLKLTAEARGKFLYRPGKALHWRLFGGTFLLNDLRASNFTPAYALTLIDNGTTDYRFDDLYLGRNSSGTYQQQISEREGGFRAPVPANLGIGRSNNFLLSANLTLDLPLVPRFFPLQVFIDAALYDPTSLRTAGERGLRVISGPALSFLDGRAGIYLPLLGTDLLLNPVKERGGILSRLAFRIDLARLAPWKLEEEWRY